MKVLHVVTLVSPDGAYGGPVRVALNQCKALGDLGHQAQVAGATRGFDVPPTEMGGVRLRLFPAQRLTRRLGFAALTSATLLSWAPRNLHSYDLIHIHLARDLVTLPVALMAMMLRVPFVVQTHGMIVRSDKRMARIIDRLVTQRVLRRARAVLYLTDSERSEIGEVGGRGALALHHLPNGVPQTSLRGDREGREVLFMARLAPRKRPLVFAHMARDLHELDPSLRFTLIGPDEGELESLTEFIEAEHAQQYLRYEGAISHDHALGRMSNAALYVLPAVDEPFPMAVLEAMSLGLPVVVTDTCGLAPHIERTGAGEVTDGSPEALEKTVLRLMNDPLAYEQASSRALSATAELFTMPAIAGRLATIYAGDAR